MQDGTSRESDEGSGWRRAAVLVGIAFATSIAQPSVLIAIPLLVFIGMDGVRSRNTFVAAVFALVVVLLGPRDGLWYAERAWGLLAGGAFVAFSVLLPRWRVTARGLASIAVAVASCAVFLAVRADAWMTLDWTVSDQLRGGFATWLDAIRVLREGKTPSPTLVSAIYRTVEAQVSVFPALLAIETLAALGAAWWLYARLVDRGGSALASVSTFRFNDHLVWLLVGGLMLVAGLAGEGVTRIGANVAVFMAALYAVRGLAVGVFVSGGISVIGYTLIALGILFAAPAVLGFAVILGVADTWLDLRARVESMAT